MSGITIYQSPIGPLAISGTDAGIQSVRFVDEDATRDPEPENGRELNAVLRTCVDQLAAYFNGDLRVFDVRLDLIGTEFERRVWGALCAIPFGETRTYLEIARVLGDEKAVRAVGRANGKNPVSIIVPCHRVIGSDGTLIGYGGGLWRKRWLLKHEGRPTQPPLFD